MVRLPVAAQRRCRETPQPEDGETTTATHHIGETVHLAELVTSTEPQTLEGHTFTNCVLYGPVVLLPLADVAVRHCDLGVPIDQLLWPMPRDTPRVGCLAVRRCEFDGCSFRGVGFAGDDELRGILERGLRR